MGSVLYCSEQSIRLHNCFSSVLCCSSQCLIRMAVLQKELFQDKLEVINSSLVADYYIAQLVCAPWLVNLAGRISLHGSFHLNSEICKLRPWFFSAQIYACALRASAINPSGKNSFRNLQYRPRTRLLYTVVLVTGRVLPIGDVPYITKCGR